MDPAAVCALSFLLLYCSFGLFDKYLAVALAHCLFKVSLAVWILKGFMSGVPKALNETAFIGGYPFHTFLSRYSYLRSPLVLACRRSDVRTCASDVHLCEYAK